MNCADAREQLLAYLHRESSPAEAAAVATHLASCGDCARAYCALDADLATLRAGVVLAPPPGLHAKLRARVAREFKPSWWRVLARFFNLSVPVYQAALLLVVVATALWLPTRAPRESAATPETKVWPPNDRGSMANPPALPPYDASRIVAVDPNIF